MKKIYTAIVVALVALALSATAAFAAVQFDSDTGTGFVGKGDVQTALGWNNKQLQDAEKARNITFSARYTTVSTWQCRNENNENIQQRRHSTEEQQVASHTARERNQITGFSLTGYSGTPTVIGSDGPQLNSCPSGPWVYVANSTQTTRGDAQLFVNGVSLQ